MAESPIPKAAQTPDMNNDRPPLNHAGRAELAIALNNAAQLFNAPRIDPLSGSTPELLGMSGVELLLSLLRMNQPRRNPRTLVLFLPPDQALPALAARTTSALRRHVEARIAEERRTLRDTYRYGRRAAAIALLLLAVCLGLSSLFDSEVTARLPLVRRTLASGFEIIGWVLLWHPIEVLGFTPLAIRSRINALQTLAALTIIVRADHRLATGTTPAPFEERRPSNETKEL